MIETNVENIKPIQGSGIQKKRRWLIETLAPDFKLLDSWESVLNDFDRANGDSLDSVIDIVMAKRQATGLMDLLTSFLFKFRDILGRSFGWDDHINTLPIPGCSESSLRDRLAEFSVQADEKSDQAITGSDLVPFRPVYSLENEKCLELSNDTVHAVMHYSLEERADKSAVLRLSVFVKTRGALGRFYMNLITPFRHVIVYPTLIKNIRKNWDSHKKMQP